MNGEDLFIPIIFGDGVNCSIVQVDNKWDVMIEYPSGQNGRVSATFETKEQAIAELDRINARLAELGLII